MSLAREGAVAVITIDHPPVNALSSDVRSGLVAALDAAVADDAVRAIVVAGAGASFCAGADIREFDLPPQPPHLSDVIQRFADSAKPVVAALHGNALGGGCELAAGCHYRVAVRGARIGLPEVNLGLLPGAGGTQRMPRLIGFDGALAMMLDGRPRAIDAAEVAGFVDEIVETDVHAAAVAFARRLATAESGPRRTANRPLPDAAPEVFQRYEEAARRRRGEPAPERIVAAVRRAIEMPFADAVARARADFLLLRDTPEAKALRHAFFAERDAGKLPVGVTEGTPRTLSTAAVIGAGTMGQGIAIALLDAGLQVTLIETAAAALARAQERIAAHYREAAAKGRIAGSRRAAAARPPCRRGRHRGVRGRRRASSRRCSRTSPSSATVFAQIDAAAAPHALLATNTSYLDVAEIAGFTRRPQEVIGLHFFSPANVMRLVEIVRTEATSPEALATGMALVRRLKKVGVVCKGKDGFIGNRMLRPAHPRVPVHARGGRAATSRSTLRWSSSDSPWGRSRSATWRGWTSAGATRPCVGSCASWADAIAICSTSWSQPSGSGRRPAPAGTAMRPAAASRSRTRRSRHCSPSTHAPAASCDDALQPAEIVERCLLGMLNEAAKIIDEGVVDRASDIDVVWLTGYGFPRFRGGPLFYADRLGLAHVVAADRGIARSLRRRLLDAGAGTAAPGGGRARILSGVTLGCIIVGWTHGERIEDASAMRRNRDAGS